MVDVSEVSDVNSEEMARMLEDMDNLDSNLFKDSRNKSTSNLQHTNLRSDSENKRRVLFKDYDMGDQLGDLLSKEEGEEFSPVEDNHPATANSKSSLMKDLFRISQLDPSTNKGSINKLDSISDSTPIDAKQMKSVGNPNDLKNEAPFNSSGGTRPEKNTVKLKNVFNDDDNVLIDLMNQSKLKEKTDDKSRRSLLMEHLFKTKSDSSFSTKDASVRSDHTAGETQKTKKEYAHRPNLPMQLLTEPIESRRPRTNVTINKDPLGLLQADLSSDVAYKSSHLSGRDNIEAETGSLRKQISNGAEDLPEWLDGTKKPERLKDAAVFHTATAQKIEAMSSSKGQEITIRDTNDQSDSPVRFINPKSHSDPDNISLFMTAQLEERTAMMSLQQREHELRTGILLSRQNEQFDRLLGIHRSKLDEQEKQFNALLKMQLDRQILLEKQIKAQQERINQYIQTLMTQATPLPTQFIDSTISPKEVNNPQDTPADDKESKNSIVEGLRQEISKLESTLRTLNERHEHEMTIQAESYKRQIVFLEEATEKFEKRAKQEVEFLEADFATKLEKLKNEQAQSENLYKEEIAYLKKEHARHIEEIHERHSQNIIILRKEHSDMIENISKAKQAESLVVETATNRKTDIENLLQKAEFIVEHINESQIKIQDRDEQTMKLWENCLRNQKDDLKVEKADLETARNALEEHRSKLMNTTERLEMRISQLLTELQKKIARNNQLEEILEKRVEHLVHEQEVFEEKMKWERDHIQTLKETWMKEEERQLKALMKEKEALVAERMQLEIRNKLKAGTDHVAQAELEAAIKAAEEATARANQERLKWHEKNAELDLQRQNLKDKESLLVRRAKELESLTQSALAKREEGARALREARLLENRQKEKCGQLQTQFESLLEREKKVAADKFQVARLFSRARLEIEKPERDVITDASQSLTKEQSHVTAEFMYHQGSLLV